MSVDPTDPSESLVPSPSTTAALPSVSPDPVSTRSSPRRGVRRTTAAGDEPISAAASPSTVGLGTAASFAVLAGSTITNTGSSTIEGDVGLHPGSAIAGASSLTVTGEIHVADAVAEQAKVDRATAYSDAAGRGPATIIPTELGGQTLKPGVYASASGTFQLTGILSLDADGDDAAVWIFQTQTTLVTASGSSVLLIDGGSYCNLFWAVGTSATLGTGTQFKGTILAEASITLNTGTRLDGRALAGSGAVTLDTNVISRSACAAGPDPTTSPDPTDSVTPDPTDSVTPDPTDSVTPDPTDSITPDPTDSITPDPTIDPVIPSDTPSNGNGGGGGPNNSGGPNDGNGRNGPDGSASNGRDRDDGRQRRHPPAITGAPVTGGAPFGHLATRAASGNSSSRIGDPAARALDPLVPRSVPLRAPPRSVPLRLHIPAIGVDARILAVGITPERAMDAPMGSPSDPVWSRAFWYRGSGVPGAPGTATIAGHVSGGLEPVFADLERIRVGDEIAVRDRRTGRDVTFVVTARELVSLDRFDDRMLRRVYGAGPVAGKRASAPADGSSRLTLITCAGDRVGSSYQHRLVVSAERVAPWDAHVHEGPVRNRLGTRPSGERPGPTVDARVDHARPLVSA